MAQQPLTETSFKNSTVTWSLLIAVAVTCVGAIMYHNNYIAEVRADYRGRIAELTAAHDAVMKETLRDWQERLDRELAEQLHRMEAEKELALIIQQIENDRARNDRRITRSDEDIQVLYRLVDELTRKSITGK